MTIPLKPLISLTLLLFWGWLLPVSAANYREEARTLEKAAMGEKLGERDRSVLNHLHKTWGRDNGAILKKCLTERPLTTGEQRRLLQLRQDWMLSEMTDAEKREANIKRYKPSASLIAKWDANKDSAHPSGSWKGALTEDEHGQPDPLKMVVLLGGVIFVCMACFLVAKRLVISRIKEARLVRSYTEE